MYPQGNHGERIPLNCTLDEEYKAPNKKVVEKRIIMDIPEEYETHDYPLGFVLFLYRVDLYNNGKYLHPINKGGKPRYIAAKCYINQTSSTTPTPMGSIPSADFEASNMLFGHHIRFGEKDELLSYDYWYKK